LIREGCFCNSKKYSLDHILIFTATAASLLSLFVGFEARGLIFGAPLALALKVPFVPLRKPGKLPGNSIFFRRKSNKIIIHSLPSLASIESFFI
jgi:adenine/guanine phosphoribosyltransferase-like PRPP-binding protein